MKKEDYINQVLSHISNRTFLPLIKSELENHIADRTDYYTEIGYTKEIAEEKAVEHMGDADSIGIKMNILHDYKKHKIISVISMVLFIIFGAAYFVITSFFSGVTPFNFYFVVTFALVFFMTVCEYIIYRFSFISKSNFILLIQGVISIPVAYCLVNYSFFSISASAIENLFSCIFGSAKGTATVTEFYDLLSIYNLVAGINMFIFSVISITCFAEINAFFKGDYNSKILENYQSYEKFMAIETVILPSILAALFSILLLIV